MTKPEGTQDQGSDGLLEDGWSSLDEDSGDGGGFASEHTTVDPSLLDRLAALDAEKEKAKASSVPDAPGLKAPDKHESTINLDISDLLAMEEFGEDEVVVQQDLARPEEPTSAPSVPIKAMSGPRTGASSSLASDISNPDQPSIEIDSAVADVDEAFSAEKTQIFVAAIEDEPTRAKLKVVQGGGQQKEYLLARDRMTIGRGTNNDILVPDIAISRQHCEITRQADGSFRMADLSSGNGTKLNGARVLDSDLFGGDRIEIGSTILEFVITGPGASKSPGQRKINVHPSENASGAGNARRRTGANNAVAGPPAAAEPAPAPAPVPNYMSQPGHNATATAFQLQQQPPAPQRSNSVPILAALIATFGFLFLLLAVVIGAKIYLDFQQDQNTTQVSNKPASDYYFEGVEHVKARNWDKAEEKFTIALEVARQEREFQVLKDAETQLDGVRAEKSNLKAWNRGQSLFEKGDFPEAIARLEEVRSGSVYSDNADALLTQARDKYAGELVDQAKTHFDAKQFDEADRKVAMALKTLPTFKPARELRAKIESLPEDSYTRPTALATNDPRTPKGRATDRKATDRPKTNSDTPPKGRATDKGAIAKTDKPPKKGTDKPPKKGGAQLADFSSGLALYRAKRYPDAISAFERIAGSAEDDFSQTKARNLARNVASFQQNYQSGLSAFSGNNWSGAARSLDIAYKLDKKISGTGVHGAELRQKLAESNYQLGKAAFASNNFSRAGLHAKKVKAYNPSHPGNAQLLGQLESKGRSMFIDANNRKGSDPTQARRIAQAIVDMLPGSSDTHKKARALLSELK